MVLSTITERPLHLNGKASGGRRYGNVEDITKGRKANVTASSLWNEIRPWLSDAGSIASLVGLLASAYVVLSVWQLRNKFLFTARMPEIVKSLRKCSEEISPLLGKLPESTRELDVVLARSCAFITAVERLCNGATRNSAQLVQKGIVKARKSRNADELWRIYSEIQKLLEELKQELRDSKWDKQ